MLWTNSQGQKFLEICKFDDKDSAFLINQAIFQGYQIYEGLRGSVNIEILKHETYRAPDAVFRPMNSGIYVFHNNKEVTHG